MRLLRLIILTAIFGGLLFGVSQVQAAQPAQATELCFPDIPGINNCLDRAFAPYWQQNGGLPVFGYPIGPVEQYRSPELGTTLTIQWAERHRMELHPQNPPAYRVLLGRMGAERLAQLGRDPAGEFVESGPQEGCLWFEQTGHNVCDQAPGVGFRSYWEANGLEIPGLSDYERSLALFGLPLTAAQPEPSANGELLLTQWFERARFEWHPEKPTEYKVMLGLLGNEIRSGSPPPATMDQSVFGVEIGRGRVAAVAARLNELQPDWVRYNGVLWSEVESQQGTRNWGILAGTEQELATISSAGADTMLIIRGTPAWAQQVPDKACGPIKPEALPAFAAFVGELVARYSQPPYNVKYWEFGNEPDVDPSLVRSASPFGCWGDESDPYYGGARYAQMLAAVYPAIKAADPEAQVVLGGLLLDCDPGTPPRNKTCLPAKFLEGILRAGGGEHFDIAAYHAYMYWGDVELDWDVLFPPWSHRGGALLGKLDFVRSTLAAYGYVKPIVMNEGGMLCRNSDPFCAANGFYEDQANYVLRLYARSIANGITGSLWYTLNGPGWQDGGLLDANQQPRPAFQAMRFIREALRNAEYTGNISSEAFEGYAFQTNDTMYEVYWTNDSSTVELTPPAGFRAAYNPVGQRIDTSGGIILSFEPIVIERAVTP